MSNFKTLHTIPLPAASGPEAAGKILAAMAGAEDREDHVFVCFRRRGRKLESGWVSGMSWKSAVEQILERAREIEASELELCLTHSWKSLPPGAPLPGNRARGVRGIRYRYGSQSLAIAPTAMLSQNTSFQRGLERFLKDAGLPPSKTVPPEVTADMFDAYQGLVLLEGGPRVAPMQRGSQLVEFATLTKDTIAAHAQLMADWMLRNVAPDGRLTYKYWPSAGREAEGNNMIRQYMGTLCLFRMADFYKSAEMAETARRNLAYNMALFYHDKDDYGYILENGEKVKLGACALAALCLLEQPELYGEQEERLYRFTRMMQRDDGSFRTFYLPAERDDGHNFYPGETLLYWAARWKKTRDDDLMKAFWRAFTYYRQWHLKHRNPAFIPWHTQAYFNIWQETKDKRLRDFVFEMNDWLLPVQQWETAPAPEEQGRFHDPDRPFGPPHASSNGVYVEGLIDAWRLAEAVGDRPRMEAYRTAMLRAIRWTMQLQFANEADMFYISQRGRVLGGLRTTTYDNTIRVDNVQHTLMGMMKVLEFAI